MIKREKGFSLIELLIVVAIILIIAAIAIPNLIRAKIASNQSSAAASLRTLGSASAMFSSTYGDGYPPTLAALGPPTAPPANCNNGAGLIDGTLAGGQKSGYSFVWTPGTVNVAPVPAGCVAGFTDGFAVTATPLSGNTGTITYCVDTSNVIVQNPTGAGLNNGVMSCTGGQAIGN